uniref:Uncharacterized protein n=1 Tax=Arundo donax TaxID=35708 RepID=A0A0A9F850_ARUDO
MLEQVLSKILLCLIHDRPPGSLEVYHMDEVFQTPV